MEISDEDDVDMGDWEDSGSDDGYQMPEIVREDSLVVFSQDEIQNKMDKDLKQVQELCGMEKDEAILIMRYYKWNTDKLNEEWFDKQE